MHRALSKVALSAHGESRNLLFGFLLTALGACRGCGVVAGDPLLKAMIAGTAGIFVKGGHRLSSRLQSSMGVVLCVNPEIGDSVAQLDRARAF